MTRIYVSLAAALLVASPAAAQWSASRADSHAPIGVMADHRHEKGEVMLSYRYMYMAMEGSRIGTDEIADADIVAAAPGGEDFTVTPTRMPMQMHMLGAMFAPSDEVTLMAMLPVLDISMDHITRAGGEFTTESAGIGDVRAGAMVGLGEFGDQSVHGNVMFSFPTGSIDELDVLPISMGNEVQLPYPMQVGSGTFDLLPGLTWLGQSGDLSWGAQGNAVIRLGENDNEYTMGNQYSGTVWGGGLLSRNFSAAVRGELRHTENIEGSDAALGTPATFVPTANPTLRGGTVLEVGPSLNFYVPRLSAFRIAAEALFPVYRDLDGPQLERDWTIVVGLQVVPVR
ncbi:MAG: transporter [Gemmatimonadota bacterium]